MLTRENIEGIIKFAHERNLFLFADEVQNIKENYSLINSLSFTRKKENTTVVFSTRVAINQLCILSGVSG